VSKKDPPSILYYVRHLVKGGPNKCAQNGGTNAQEQLRRESRQSRDMEKREREQERVAEMF
jgi:hypothetical protein